LLLCTAAATVGDPRQRRERRSVTAARERVCKGKERMGEEERRGEERRGEEKK